VAHRAGAIATALGGLALACATAHPSAPALPPAGRVAGTWDIALHGQPLGTETLTISDGGDVWSSRVLLTGAQIELSTRTTYSPEGEPAGYRLEGRTASKYVVVTLEVDRPGHGYVGTSVNGEGSSIALSWSGQAALLDPDVVGHWAALSRRWRGEKVSFPAIIPQDSVVAEVTLEPGGTAPEGTSAVKATLRGVESRLLIDADGTLQAFSLPARGLRAVRRGAPPDLLRALVGGQAKPAADPEPEPAGTERAVDFKSGGLWLYGTLTLPAPGKARPPIAIFVPGSGPVDRDGTAGGVRPFRDLARTLAAAGVASLRYDKVTFTYRAPPGRPGATMTLEEESVADLRAALAFARSLPEVDGKALSLVAHGTGGTVACLVAGADPGVTALVLLAAPAELADRAFLRQLRLRAERSGRDKAAVDREQGAVMEELGRARDGKIPVGQMVQGAPAGFWADWMKRDPVALAAAVPARALLVQGGQDWETLPADAEALEKARAAAGRRTERLLLPDANHYLVRVQAASDGSEYGVKAYLSPAARTAVARFLAPAENVPPEGKR
jgi:dienelactone hydrolase